ncbi:MAG TPA: CHAT domain-containing protein, partial [Rhodothermales bacterium]|nr:CHAT domain-containing protein [Rhodothermales bacterium]
ADARARLAEFQQRLTLAYADPTLNKRDRLYKTKALQDSLAAAEDAYAQVYQDLKSASPHWNDAFLSSKGSVDLRQVQRTLVPEDGLLLLYQMGTKTSHVFLVPPGRAEVEVFPLLIDENQAAALNLPAGPLTTDVLQTLLNGDASDESQRPGLLQRFAKPDTLQAATDSIAHVLWQILVPDALRPRLLAAENVVLIPDGGLHFLPFEALVVEPGADDSDHTFWLDVGPVIRYAPSLATLDRLAQNHSSGWAQTTTLLSLSNPTFDPQAVAAQSTTEEAPALTAKGSARARYANRGGTLGALPGTARETRAIVRALGEEKSTLEVIQGVDATEAALREALPGKRYLHLATHGLVDAQHNSLFASLVLTPPPGQTNDLANDGFLQLHEIYDLPLKDAELAVLSACQSSVGTTIEGEGVFALSRGFLTAGARRVIASQWDVNDASTASLIGAFFEAIFEDERAGRPVDFARALRDAKRRIRQEGAWQSPFYWAPFVLIGAS